MAGNSGAEIQVSTISSLLRTVAHIKLSIKVNVHKLPSFK